MSVDSRRLTTQEALRILPMDGALREKLLSEWESYDHDKRLEISDRIWELLGEYQKSLQDIYFEKLQQDVLEGKQKLIGNLDELALEKVWEHFGNVLNGKHEESEEISRIRKELFAAMQEDNA